MQPPRPAAPPPVHQQEPAYRSHDPAHGVVDEGAGSDILDLTDSMAAAPPPAPAPSFRTIDGQPDVIFDDEPAPPPPPYRHNADDIGHAQASGYEQRELLSNSTSAAVDSAFGALAGKALMQSSCTIEDLVREMLRPMLKTWLDDNLPGLVERLVRAEIERVSRGRR
jgi:cell pole-organizing protein PopZ